MPKGKIPVRCALPRGPQADGWAVSKLTAIQQEAKARTLDAFSQAIGDVCASSRKEANALAMR